VLWLSIQTNYPLWDQVVQESSEGPGVSGLAAKPSGLELAPTASRRAKYVLVASRPRETSMSSVESVQLSKQIINHPTRHESPSPTRPRTQKKSTSKAPKRNQAWAQSRPKHTLSPLTGSSIPPPKTPTSSRKFPNSFSPPSTAITSASSATARLAPARHTPCPASRCERIQIFQTSTTRELAMTN
jgi:hypothetical protein